MKKTLSCNRENYLSMEQSNVLKGVLALCVLLCHTVPASGVFSGNVLTVLIGSLGYLSVAGFFFISGYGVAAQYRAKGEQYLKSFFKNRVFSIYLLTIFLIIVYAVFRIILGISIPKLELFQSFFIGGTIVSNGWYLQIVILFYILWYLAVKCTQKEQIQFWILTILVLAYMLIGILFLYSFWYQSSLGFLLGVYWQNNKQKIDDWLFEKGKRALVLTVSLVGFCVTFILTNGSFVAILDSFCARFLSTPKNIFTNVILTSHVRVIISCLAAAMFVILIIGINTIFCKYINCGLWRFLGKYSLEIYVLQGIPLHIFKATTLKIENGWLYIAAVIVATVILAVITFPIVRFIINIPKKYIK